MKQIDENSRRLENIELLLKSIDYQLTRLVNEIVVAAEKGSASPGKAAPVEHR